jgi:hypothetical protein
VGGGQQRTCQHSIAELQSMKIKPTRRHQGDGMNFLASSEPVGRGRGQIPFSAMNCSHLVREGIVNNAELPSSNCQHLVYAWIPNRGTETFRSAKCVCVNFSLESSEKTVCSFHLKYTKGFQLAKPWLTA